MNTALSAIPAGSYWRLYDTDTAVGDIIAIIPVSPSFISGIKFNGEALSEDEISYLNFMAAFALKGSYIYIPLRFKSITVLGKVIAIFATDVPAN